jgi:hypothetical protein
LKIIKNKIEKASYVVVYSQQNYNQNSIIKPLKGTNETIQLKIDYQQ